jgi:hypothetical protein
MPGAAGPVIDAAASRSRRSAWAVAAAEANRRALLAVCGDERLLPPARGSGTGPLGCGVYGCVMPTSDVRVVFKITSDPDEAGFVAAALGEPDQPPGVVAYFAGADRSRPLSPYLVETEAVNLWIAAVRPDLDGVWWNDRLDPASLSAPRGVILPHAASRWQPVRRYSLLRGRGRSSG